MYIPTFMFVTSHFVNMAYTHTTGIKVFYLEKVFLLSPKGRLWSKLYRKLKLQSSAIDTRRCLSSVQGQWLRGIRGTCPPIFRQVNDMLYVPQKIHWKVYDLMRIPDLCLLVITFTSDCTILIYRWINATKRCHCIGNNFKLFSILSNSFVDLLQFTTYG